MVKQADKKAKRSPLLPVFGAILVVALGGIAYFLSQNFVLKIPQVRSIASQSPQLALIASTVFVWLVLAGIGYFLVALLVGKDPNDSNQIPLPPRKKEIKKRR
jgi:hypothetical protein